MNATNTRVLTIDGMPVAIDGERNLLEMIRKADIDLPTFCYHSDLSVYGACRLCIVDIEERGIQGACSTPPEAGMVVRTQTAELREIRKITVELLLANHDYSCPTCPKQSSCQLQDLARRLGVDDIRFKPVLEDRPKDTSSPSLVRDPNKCVLCGDCVRFCSEVQGIGAIDFAFRGHQTTVMPAFASGMGDVECVNCGQCAAVCPTGALAPRSEVDEVWAAIHDPKKVVVAQVAPAVRVALGECFGMPPGTVTTGQIVAAMKRIGFDVVYDTSFSADLTVVEEANEFLGRKANGEKLPQFTSCCPGWVKFAEHFYPQLLGNLSSCKSPQQMLGALVKQTVPAERGVAARDVVCVSIMPCTAKKFEAKRPEFAPGGVPDVDHVLTTQELGRMIEEAGVKFARLDPQSFDMPMGFKTGAGVIFGNSGGVSEAVLRYAAEKVTGQTLKSVDFPQVRGEGGLRQTTLKVGDVELKLAVVHGLRNAHEVCQKVLKGEAQFDLIEVMACPGGCIGGAGQPVAKFGADARRQRTRGLYEADKNLDLHKSQENYFVTECYDKVLGGEVGGHRAHALLHTHYSSRRRVPTAPMSFGNAKSSGHEAVSCSVCVGTNCFVKGSQKILQSLLQHVEDNGLEEQVRISGSFCFEKCEEGPNVQVAGKRIGGGNAAGAVAALTEKLNHNGNGGGS